MEGISISDRQFYALIGALTGFLTSIFGRYPITFLIIIPIVGAVLGIGICDAEEKKRIEYEKMISKSED